jgi:hypothetical protein
MYLKKSTVTTHLEEKVFCTVLGCYNNGSVTLQTSVSSKIVLALTSERVNKVLKASEYCQLNQEFEQAYLQVGDGSVGRAIIRVVVQCRRILTKHGSAQ